MYDAKIHKLVQKDFNSYMEELEQRLGKDYVNENYTVFEDKKYKYEDYLINRPKDDTIADIIVEALDYVDWDYIEEEYNQSQK